MRNSKIDEVIIGKLYKRGFSLVGNILRYNIDIGIVDRLMLSMSGGRSTRPYTKISNFKIFKNGYKEEIKNGNLG